MKRFSLYIICYCFILFSACNDDDNNMPDIGLEFTDEEYYTGGILGTTPLNYLGSAYEQPTPAVE